MTDIIEILKKDIGVAFNKKLTIKGRTVEQVNPRVAFGWICIKYLKLTFEETASYIGKDRSTVAHYCKIFNNFYKFDREFKNNFDKLDLQKYLISNNELIELKIDRLYFKIKKLQAKLLFLY